MISCVIKTGFLSAFIFVHTLVCSHKDLSDHIIMTQPVTNCIGAPAQTIDSSIACKDLYRQLPCSPEQGRYSAPRIHQCLFNEMGRICECGDDEALIEFLNFYYLEDGEKTSRFWVPCSSFTRTALYDDAFQEAIPKPICYKNRSASCGDSVLTLILPWVDNFSEQIYSVGTRFVRNPSEDTAESWSIFVPDYAQKKVRKVTLSKEQGSVQEQLNQADQRAFFIDLLRKWISYNEGVIPYCFGGCSYTHTCHDGVFALEHGERDGKPIAYWTRPELSSQIDAGFDCSGLVLRAAQIAGIPYFYKNTTTIAAELLSVSTEQVKEGDLLCMKGHVMVVSDLENNMIIDAVGYGSGYGCVREVSLNEAFVDISTYQELFDSCVSQTDLYSRKRDETCGSLCNEVKIVSMFGASQLPAQNNAQSTLDKHPIVCD